MKLKKAIYKYNFSKKPSTENINNGDVFVNGIQIKDKEYELKENDIIKIGNEEVVYKKITNLALYKPKGYLSARKDKTHKCVIELLDKKYSCYNFSIAGRLDLDSEGLLILSTSGRFANKIANPIYKVKKIYEVIVNKKIDDITLAKLKEPMMLKDNKFQLYKSQVCDVQMLDKNKLMIILDMGKYHQIKEMIKKVGYEVISLKRIQIANINLRNIKKGEYYEFSEDEIAI